MEAKPSYEELEQRVKELEEGAIERIQAEMVIEKFFEQPMNIHIIAGFEGLIHRVNMGWQTLLGYSNNEVEGTIFFDLVHPEDQVPTIEEMEKLGKGATTFYFENRYRHKNGNYRFLAWSAIASLKDQLVYAVASDITDRKQAEEALRKSEEKFRFLAENMVDIIWIVDQNFQTTYVSPSIENVLGFTPEERKRQFLEQMITPESLQKVQAMFIEELQRDEEETVDPDRSVIIEVEYYHKEGSTVWMENIVKAIRGPGGAIVGMHGVSRNINERKQVEEALKEREMELERKNLRLEALNSALKILLERRNQDKTELEENVLTNMKQLVLPYVEKLKKVGLSDKQGVFADILQSNLEDIVSPFIRKLSSKYLSFTTTELKVANLVKQGLRTKEIADLLNCSPETVSGHRKSMRKKLKLTDKKSNLRTHLLYLSDG